ncbi:unnamed protein product [Rhizoctonia solani]|uniref:Cupin type-1 domain-containing protein n=1 Tax=Rhizoctonia solani TaxID=456999 RepID=A0A8H3HI90_9AGAM|nr:unnamed protein product [Rhizoctonia solani]
MVGTEAIFLKVMLLKSPVEYGMPLATIMARVDMRLNAGAIREMHWHLAAEWELPRRRISGDLWYFPKGIPHSIQGLNDTADGCEFLLVLDDGTFSEGSAFLLTDWIARVPKKVLAKNF